MQTERMFRRALKALGGPRHQREVAGGRWVLAPVKHEYPPQPGSPGLRPARRSAADRRRRNLTWLAGFIVVTFLLGLFRPLRFLLVANLVADVLLIGYLVAVLWFAARPAPVRPRAEAYDVEGDEQERPPEVAGGLL